MTARTVAGSVLQSQLLAGAHRLLGEPADVSLERSHRLRRGLRRRQQVPAREVELAVDPHRHGLPGRRGLERAVERLHRRHPRALAARQRDHLGTRPQLAAGDAARVGALLAAQHPLDREAHPARLAGRHLDGLEVLEQRRPGVPAQPLRALDHVVPVQRAHRQRRHRAEPDLRGEAVEVGHDPVEDLLRPVDEVHLVDRQHHVADTQQRGHRGVPPRLLDDAAPSVDQHDRHLGGRGAGDHVARVLLVARRVGEDEAPPRRREVAVGDVDGDALLALGAQAVGQQRQIQMPVAVARVRDLREVLELVGEDRLGVVEQPPDQGRLPVVHRAGRRQSQRVDRLRSSRQPCGPPWRPRSPGRRPASPRAR